MGHQSTGFVCVMGFGLPIWFDGFWFGVLCWWVQIEVAGVVGFGCCLCRGFYFGGWGLRLWLVVVVVAVAVAVGGGGSGC